MPPAPALQTLIPKRPAANTLVLLALWIVFYASFTLFTSRRCSMTPTPSTPRSRERCCCATTGSRSTPTAFATWRKRRCSTGRWRPASSSSASAPPPPAFRSRSRSWRSPSRWRASPAAHFAAHAQASTPRYPALLLRILPLHPHHLPDAMVCLWLTLALLCFWLTRRIR